MSGIGFLVISQRSRVAQTGAALAPITRITYHGHTQLVLFSETHRSTHIIFKLSESNVSKAPSNNLEPTYYLYGMAAFPTLRSSHIQMLGLLYG